MHNYYRSATRFTIPNILCTSFRYYINLSLFLTISTHCPPIYPKWPAINSMLLSIYYVYCSRSLVYAIMWYMLPRYTCRYSAVTIYRNLLLLWAVLRLFMHFYRVGLGTPAYRHNLAISYYRPRPSILTYFFTTLAVFLESSLLYNILVCFRLLLNYYYWSWSTAAVYSSVNRNISLHIDDC